MQEIFDRYEQVSFQEPIYGQEDFLAKIYRLQGNKKGSKVNVQDYFSKSQDYLMKLREQNDLDTYYSKMLETFYPLAEALTSSSSSLNWTGSDMIANSYLPTVETLCHKTENAYSLRDFLETDAEEKYSLTYEKTEQILYAMTDKEKEKLNRVIGDLFNDKTVTPELEQIKSGAQADEVMRVHIVIRKLTPLECFRLQGFADEQFNLARSAVVNGKPISDSQLYKMAGNSVTVPVVSEIARQYLKE